MKTLFMLAALAAQSLAPAPAAEPLPRKAFLGVGMPPQLQQGRGAVLGDVLPGGTATTLGLRPGDVVVEAGARPVSGPAELVAYAAALSEGAPVDLRVQRGGRTVRLQGTAAARPLESYAGGQVDYGAVPWRGGQLRDILVTPRGVAEPPVVFLIQGFTCASVESPDPNHSYRRLGQELIARGLAYYRVEKPGLGDSRGTPRCEDIDYSTELDAFRAAYRHLTQERGVAPQRVFMLGHSLGGLQAPMLAAEAPPRGVVVYGTVARNWADYHRDISQFQDFLMRGEDPVTSAAASDRYRDIFRLFYLERKSPQEVAAMNPAYAAGLRDGFGWDGRTNLFGRHFKYAQDLAHQPLLAAWRDAHTHVLALYGEADVVALNDEDHRLIADIANHYRPGTGRFLQVSATGHAMDRIGSPAEARAQARATGELPEGPFNPEVAEAIASWVRGVMASPAVTRAPG